MIEENNNCMIKNIFLNNSFCVWMLLPFRGGGPNDPVLLQLKMKRKK